MTYSAHHLAGSERVVIETRPHGRAMLLPALTFVVATGTTSFLVAMTVSAGYGWRVGGLVLAGAVLVALPLSVLPWMRWRATAYVVTDRRLVVRYGVVHREGRDLPLGRVTDVWFGQGALGRLLGYGTVVVACGAGREPLVLDAVPRVEQVQQAINGLVDAEDRRFAASGPVVTSPGDRGADTLAR